jgi:hypothetical protein
MVSRAELCLEKALECYRAAQRAQEKELKAMYLDLAKQWREMAEQVEMLERNQRER